jgi:hypothetical protein
MPMAGDGIPVYGVAGRGRTGWTESGQNRMKPGSLDGLDGSIHVAKVRVAGSNLVVRSKVFAGQAGSSDSASAFWTRRLSIPCPSIRLNLSRIRPMVGCSLVAAVDEVAVDVQSGGRPGVSWLGRSTHWRATPLHSS